MKFKIQQVWGGKMDWNNLQHDDGKEEEWNASYFEESGHFGIKCLFERNPTLNNGEHP